MSNIGRLTGQFTTPASGPEVITVDDAFAVHFWYSRVTADDTIQAHQQFGHGFAVSGQADCGMTSAEDAANLNQRDGRNANCILITDAPGTTDVILGGLVTFNAANISIAFTTTTAGYRIHYEIWFGTDGSAELVQAAASASPITSLTMTTPDMVLGWCLGQAHPAASQHSFQSFGVAVDNAGIDQWCLFTYMGDNDTDFMGSALVAGEFAGQYDVDYTNWTIQITAIGSNGCTWTGTNGDQVIFLFLDLAGDNVHVDTFAKSTTTAPVTQQMPTFGFTPDGYAIASANFDLQTINTNRLIHASFGAYDEETGVGHSALAVGTASSAFDRASQSHNSEVLQGSDALQASGIEWSGTPDAITDATPSIEWNPNTTGATDDVIIGVYGHEQQAVGITATGAPSIPIPTASGVAEVINTATGAVVIAAVLAAGVAVMERSATGAPVMSAIQATGVAEVIHTSSGSPSISIPTAAGVAEVINTASGTPVISIPTAAGTAGIDRNATGAPIIPAVESAGVAEVVNTASGSPIIPVVVAMGVAEVINTSSGAPAIPLVSAAGVANIITDIAGNGATVIATPTASGVAQVIKTSSGTPSIPVIIAAGVASINIVADGAPVLPAVMAAGVAEVINTSSGAPITPVPVAAGVAKIINTASGAPVIPLINAAGVAKVINTASGTPSIPLPIAAGVAAVTRAAISAPALTEPLIVAGGQIITITLTNDTWITAGFDQVRQIIINGMTSAQSEEKGWNREVRDKESITSAVRTSNTVVTITLTASLDYDITVDEVITITVPDEALDTSIKPLIAIPTIGVTADAPILLAHVVKFSSVSRLVKFSSTQRRVTFSSTSRTIKIADTPNPLGFILTEDDGIILQEDDLPIALE